MKHNFELMSECPWCELAKVKSLSSSLRFESVDPAMSGSFLGCSSSDVHEVHHYKVNGTFYKRCTNGQVVRQEEARGYQELTRYAIVLQGLEA